MNNEQKERREPLTVDQIKELLSDAFAALQGSVQMVEREPNDPKHSVRMTKAMKSFRDALNEMEKRNTWIADEVSGLISEINELKCRLVNSAASRKPSLHTGQTITIQSHGALLKLAGIAVTPGSGEECMHIRIGKHFSTTLSDCERKTGANSVQNGGENGEP